jgi:lactoylglutathione lyase
MPQLKKLTPNLIVSNVERSVAFYCDVLGFIVTDRVPEASPLVFAALTNGPVQIFLNAPGPAYAEYPGLEAQPIGASMTLFMELENIGSAYDALKDNVKIVMPFEKKWYGVTEFAIADPDGYVITFAERD